MVAAVRVVAAVGTDAHQFFGIVCADTVGVGDACLPKIIKRRVLEHVDGHPNSGPIRSDNNVVFGCFDLNVLFKINVRQKQRCGGWEMLRYKGG